MSQGCTTQCCYFQIVHKLLNLANSRKIHFTLPDEAFGPNDNIMVTGASVKSGMIYVILTLVPKLNQV